MNHRYELLLVLLLVGCGPSDTKVEVVQNPVAEVEETETAATTDENGAPLCSHCGSNQSFGLNAGFRQCFECWGIFEADADANRTQLVNRREENVPEVPILETPRLRLRPWRTADSAPFAAMNADPRVMQWLLNPLSPADSDALMARFVEHFAEHVFGPWAVEVPGKSEFIGFVGLVVPSFTARFTPCVEIGWRLAAEHWGQGYATEAAQAALAFGFDTLRLDEIVSFTVPENIRSRRVMEKLGLTHDPRDDFDHPKVPEGHPRKRHVLYRVRHSR